MKNTPNQHPKPYFFLFDFGGVFAEEGFYNALANLALEQNLTVDLPKEGMLAVYDSGYVTGQGNAADFWALLRKRTGLKGDDEELTRRVLAGFRVRPGMRALVRDLRAAGYRVGLLTDQTDWLDRLDAEQDFYREFDRLFISYRMGKGKRDPTLYDDIARELGEPPERILFIDDNPENVRLARSRGWQAILFTDEESLRQELRRRGILARASG